MDGKLSCTTSLVTPGLFQANNSHLFPTEGAVRWFMRRYRSELMKAKAIALINGRLMLDQPAFEMVIRDVGDRAVRDAHPVHGASQERPGTRT